MNTLFYGDNLDILRQHIDDESVDLIYLDPPFNSNKSYNILFKDESGADSEAQISAFDDSWHWGDSAEETYYELINNCSPGIASMVSALRQFIGTNQMMAYIVMITIRLVELHRVLKPTGSLYFHCDPTASHYIKIILDTIFGIKNFQNEIVWKRASAHNDPKKYGDIHDTILFYTKTDKYKWNTQYTQYSDEYIKSEWRKLPSGRFYKCENMLDPQMKMNNFDFMGTLARWRTNFDGMMKLWNENQTEVPNSHGRIKLGKNGKPIKRCRILFLDEMPGVPMQSWWDNVISLRGGSKERLGYPTQKPTSLLERIILSSSEEGDIVLDPFSGCGTSISAAEKLKRKWLCIDITQLAIALHKSRLKDSFGLEPNKDYNIIGEPQSLHDAIKLAEDDRFQFEWWALSLVKARPAGDKKKGSDKGIDGIISFTDDATVKAKQVLVQVKSGHVNSGLIRDFRGTIDRESNAVMGVFITLENPSRNMETEALEAGYYISPFTGQKHRKIQIFTIEDLLNGENPDLPISASFSTFKKAEKVKKDKEGSQGKLDL